MQIWTYDFDHMNTVLLPSALHTLLPEDVHEACAGHLFRKGQCLFKAGQRPQWMYYVVVGEVLLERPGIHGDRVVLQRTRQGFVSEASLRTTAYHCDAVAVVETQVIQIPAQALRSAMDTDAGFASRWITMLNTEVRRLRLNVERLSMKSVKDRVLHLIDTEGENGTYVAATGLKSLAAELGVTHEALYRTLSALEKQNILQRKNGTITVAR